MKTLLGLGADPNAHSRFEARPLCQADARTRELLLAHGAKVDFWSACALGMTDRVRTMLAANPALADADDPDSASVKPMYYAADRGHLRIVKLLMAHGAKPGPHALLGAVIGGNKDVARYLLDNGADMGVQPPLRFVMHRSDRRDMVRFIQDYRAAHPDRW